MANITPQEFLAKKATFKPIEVEFPVEGPTAELGVASFPMKGIDFTTGQTVDLNSFPIFEPVGTVAQPATTQNTGVAGLPEIKDFYQTVADRRIQDAAQLAVLEDQLARGRFSTYLPQIQALTEQSKEGDLLRQLGYEQDSPRVQQGLAYQGQLGAANLMQATASQANAAANMRGRYQGKNIAIA